MMENKVTQQNKNKSFEKTWSETNISGEGTLTAVKKEDGRMDLGRPARGRKICGLPEQGAPVNGVAHRA